MSEIQDEANYQYGFECGEQAERIRLIKLLVQERGWLMTTGDEDNIRDAEGMLLAIELINGEIKPEELRNE